MTSESVLPAAESTAPESSGGRTAEPGIVFRNVSKFYGEILGVNRITLDIPPGITGLVGPNGSGKTTLMNLMTGLLKPTQGAIRVLGHSPQNAESLFGQVGYCTQFDSFPSGITGYQFIYSYLLVHGLEARRAAELTREALERVNLADVGHRKVAGYSKGMRQRIRLAQAIAHKPRVLVLDEPLNGLDPMARAEVIDLFQDLAHEGSYLIISSHILHEVDMISDQVVLLSSGYVVAEGDISGVRTEMDADHPIQVLVCCEQPGRVASRLFEKPFIVEVGMLENGEGILVRTREPDNFYAHLNAVLMEEGLQVDTISVADANVRAVYQYLIGEEGEAR